MGETLPKKLNRFTSLPVVLDLLKRKKLVLLDPMRWEDRNDAEILLEYKRRRNLNGLCALCFSSGDETIHHWNAYAPGIGGCCIEFSYRKLSAHLDGIPGIVHREIRYVKLNGLNATDIAFDDVPFLKRWPYRCEAEYRILWTGDLERPSVELEIDLDCINRITVNQRMPEVVFDSIKEILRESVRDPEKRISRSTLIENRTWINHFAAVRS